MNDAPSVEISLGASYHVTEFSTIVEKVLKGYALLYANDDGESSASGIVDSARREYDNLVTVTGGIADRENAVAVDVSIARRKSIPVTSATVHVDAPLDGAEIKAGVGALRSGAGGDETHGARSAEPGGALIGAGSGNEAHTSVLVHGDGNAGHACRRAVNHGAGIR